MLGGLRVGGGWEWGSLGAHVFCLKGSCEAPLCYKAPGAEVKVCD